VIPKNTGIKYKARLKMYFKSDILGSPPSN
jgi:hypothetical protein